MTGPATARAEVDRDDCASHHGGKPRLAVDYGTTMHSENSEVEAGVPMSMSGVAVALATLEVGSQPGRMSYCWGCAGGVGGDRCRAEVEQTLSESGRVAGTARVELDPHRGLGQAVERPRDLDGVGGPDRRRRHRRVLQIVGARVGVGAGSSTLRPSGPRSIPRPSLRKDRVSQQRVAGRCLARPSPRRARCARSRWPRSAVGVAHVVAAAADVDAAFGVAQVRAFRWGRCRSGCRGCGSPTRALMSMPSP